MAVARLVLRCARVRACLVAVIAAMSCGPSPGLAPAGDAPRGPSDAPAAADAPIEMPGDAGAISPYVLDETFDDRTAGVAPGAPWTTTGDVAVRAELATDRAAELAGASSLDFSPAPLSGRVVVEAKVMPRDTAGFKAIPYLYDPAGAAVASVSFQDGNIQTHVGGTTVTIEPFVANVWYRVRVVADTARGTFDLYVDGVRKEHDQPLRAPAASIARVSYYLDGPAPGGLVVDRVRVYTEAAVIGDAPQPVFDPRDFGAAGDGTTLDTAAIQRAVDAATGTGGSVVLADGTFLSGTVRLGSNLTFYIAPSATLLGSPSTADYPAQAPASGNTQLGNLQRALLYAEGASDLVVDGGGAIDGQGDAFGGVEATRPVALWWVLSQRVTVRHLYVKKGAVWSVVGMESDHVRIEDVNVQSNGITHDGIDIVDGSDVVVDHVTVQSGDDAMCLKTGVRRGIDGVVVTDSMFSGDAGGTNGIKLGTGSYGAFRNITVEDVTVKDVQYAAMAVESRQGADISGVAFSRVWFAHAGSAFFVYLAQQAETHPAGDVPKLGSIDGVTFTDIAGRTSSYGASPHQASLVTGHVFAGATYAIHGLRFERVTVAFTGGLDHVPPAPPEATPNQYPESNMFGDLPAAAYYLRHVDDAAFIDCVSTLASPDARPVTLETP